MSDTLIAKDQRRHSRELDKWRDTAAQLLRDLQTVRQELQAARSALAQSESETARLRAQAQTAEAGLSVIRRQVATLERRLRHEGDESQSALAAAEARSSALADEIQTAHRQAETAERRHQDEIIKLRNGFETSEAGRIAALLDLEAQRAIAAEQETALEKLRDRLHALRSTRSWRITGPFRRLGKLLKPRRRTA
jgi:chromosome segregation ATPase